MKKHVVFMVHGLGEQTPGETVDEFVGAACEELNLSAPVSNTTLNLVNADETQEGILGLFPAHQRRLQGPNPDEELVFAEVHWADISPAPSGVIATALDLLRLVLGMGYIALDNVQNNVVRENAIVQHMVPWFVWLFYAVIAPLNLFLLIGAVTLLADPFALSFDENPQLTYLLFALFGGGFAYFGTSRARSAHSYMDKMVARAMGVFGAITVLFAAMFALDLNLSVLAPLSETCSHEIARTTMNNLSCFTGLGVVALQGSWLLAVTFLIALLIASASGLRKHLWEKRSIYLAVCSAMLVLWMIITVAIWSLVVSAMRKLPTQQEIPALALIDDGFAEATETLIYGVISLVVLVIAAAFVAIQRTRYKHALSESETHSSDIDKKYGRLILNPWVNLALFVGIAAFAFSAYTAFARFLVEDALTLTAGEGVWWQIYNWAIGVDAALRTYDGAAFFVITAIGFIIFNYSSVIASIVGVARDVTTYLTRTERDNPMERNAQSSYFFADEIQARFRIVVAHMMDQEGRANISRITFMTHSQGTVIAAVGLKTLAPDLPVKPTLITMGSPLTQIYGHYFEANYQFDETTNGALRSWFNIYRRDDFVGTRVQGNGVGAQNVRIRAKGHSHYWSDQIVWDQFKKLGIFSD